jgi:hypothetical protein
MMEEIVAIIGAAFPAHPVPDIFFAGPLPPQDVQEDFARVVGRPWTSLSPTDWRMTGSTPAAYRAYIAPQTFAFYVPSFLVGGIAEPEFRDLALEAILPNNRWRVPRGEWWASFAAAFTDPQRKAIKSFLAFQRKATNLDFNSTDEELVSAAENVWA